VKKIDRMREKVSILPTSVYLSKMHDAGWSLVALEWEREVETSATPEEQEAPSASEEIPGGLRFRFAPTRGLKDSLTELVRLEAECCAWMVFAMSEAAAGIGLSITANGVDGERAVRETFAPLAGPTRS